jgi:hypothetical protein
MELIVYRMDAAHFLINQCEISAMTRVLMEPYQIKLASQILNPKQDLSEANISINIDDALKKLASD